MPEDFVHTARTLLQETDLPLPDVAFAAGFADVRAVDNALRRAYGVGLAQLRSRLPACSAQRATDPVKLSLRLSVRPPFAYGGVFGHLAACAVPGCEEVRDGAYRRVLRLPHGCGIAALTPHAEHVECTLRLADRRDLTVAINQCRRLLDLDTDPRPIVEALIADAALGPVVRCAPGQRIPGAVDADELAVRVILSQQVSLRAAATHAGRLVARFGRSVTDPDGALTHAFPSVHELVGINPDELALPGSRRVTLTTLIARLADGTIALSPSADLQEIRTQLLALPGIGPWTAEVIAMRGLGDPDAFPATDLGLRAAAAQLGLATGQSALVKRSRAWRPWRSYATQHLWTTLNHAVNTWPPKEILD